MPRQSRIDLPGYFYHVIARGIERTSIFRRARDYQDFLARLAKGLEKTGNRCFAWALMPNHIHLLILSGVKGLVSLVHPLLTGYATTFNLRYQRVGHLFQNRYKAILCDADSYFLELVRYIHLNPVRAGLVKTFDELVRYPWTGHGAVLGKINLAWQESEALLSHFGQDLGSARSQYSRFIQDGWSMGYQDRLEGGGLRRSNPELGSESEDEDSDLAFDSRILGDSQFVESIWREANEQELLRAQSQKAFNFNTLRLAAAHLLDVPEVALRQKGRQERVGIAKSLIVFGGVEWLGLKNVELAKVLKMTPGGVSRALERGRDLAHSELMLDLKNLLA